MGFRGVVVAVLLIGWSDAQNIGVCIPSTSTNNEYCQNIERDDSQAVCRTVETRIDCALNLARGQADMGVFSEEEMVLLSHQQPNDNRVVASIRDVTRITEPFAFEAVAVVPANHTGGLEGLRGGRYCHPGLDQTELRWSPRVLKTLERAAARTDRCPGANTAGRTAEEMEVETLSQFFGSACRPGPWSANTSVDADLKNRFPSLCSLCGTNTSCSRYNLDMGITIAGVNNNNRHIQALECLRTNNNRAVAYVAWQHVREFFEIRNPSLATSFALLCEDNTLRVLTSELLASTTAPCSFVKQPWSAIVTSTSRAADILTNLQSWWPNGVDPGGNTWQSNLYSALVGGISARVIFQETPQTPLQYTQGIRNFTAIDASSSCMPVHRWCTINPQEHIKCMWVRNAAFTLGLEPVISCQMRATTFECLADIRNNAADFIATKANYGFLARQHYKLSAVKLVQNSPSNPNSFSRVVALIKESSTADITRFENLRGKRACFPEFGGISYMAFVRTAQERSVIKSSECDYARAVGEFFDSACAPGALANSHALGETSFNATSLCTVCRPSVTVVGGDNFTCAYNHTNMFYGNSGTLSCLAQPENDVAFLELEPGRIDQQLRAANLTASSVRALCRNNTLAFGIGVNITQDCLLAFVVDSEVLARRNDAVTNSINALLDTLDFYFGYTMGSASQLINFRIYSAFDGTADLLFLNTAGGLSEPSSDANNVPARNYNELFRHLDACTGAAAPVPGLATRNFFSILSLIVSAFFTRYVVY